MSDMIHNHRYCLKYNFIVGEPSFLMTICTQYHYIMLTPSFDPIRRTSMTTAIHQ